MDPPYSLSLVGFSHSIALAAAGTMKSRQAARGAIQVFLILLQGHAEVMILPVLLLMSMHMVAAFCASADYRDLCSSVLGSLKPCAQVPGQVLLS